VSISAGGRARWPPPGYCASWQVRLCQRWRAHVGLLFGVGLALASHTVASVLTLCCTAVSQPLPRAFVPAGAWAHDSCRLQCELRTQRERRRRRSSRATTCGLCIATTFVLNCGMACVGWSAGWVHGAGGCTRTWAPGIGGAPRDAQAAVDVGATTFGIARSQDRGRGLNGS
jgi:hypothetical protein